MKRSREREEFAPVGMPTGAKYHDLHDGQSSGEFTCEHSVGGVGYLSTRRYTSAKVSTFSLPTHMSPVIVSAFPSSEKIQ